MDLGFGAGVAEGQENCGLEGDDRGGSIVGAKVRQHSCVLLVNYSRGEGGGVKGKRCLPKPDFGI